MGDGIGGEVVRMSGKKWRIVLMCFLIGAFITIAEPDLQVLARQVPAVPDLSLIHISMSFRPGPWATSAWIFC